jgi:hypothetical protein
VMFFFKLQSICLSPIPFINLHEDLITGAFYKFNKNSGENKSSSEKMEENIFQFYRISFTVRGASKIKLKNVNKKRMATARRLIFLEFLKASIADLITLFFSSVQNSEGVGDGDSGDSFADPCQFLPFLKTKIQLSASLLYF